MSLARDFRELMRSWYDRLHLLSGERRAVEYFKEPYDAPELVILVANLERAGHGEAVAQLNRAVSEGTSINSSSGVGNAIDVIERFGRVLIHAVGQSTLPSRDRERVLVRIAAHLSASESMLFRLRIPRTGEKFDASSMKSSVRIHSVSGLRCWAIIDKRNGICLKKAEVF